MQATATPTAVEFGWGPRLIEAVVAAERVLPEAAVVLAEIDPQTLDAESRVGLIQAWDRVAAMVAGFQQQALAAVVEATTDLGLPGREARHEVGAALRLHPSTAAAATQVAADLADRLPSTLAALTAGRIGYRQAADLAEAVHDLPAPLAAAVEARVLPAMGDQTMSQTRQAVRRAVLAADPAGAAERTRRAATGRRIEPMPLADGMAGWWVTLPVQQAGPAWDHLTRQARAEQTARRRLGLDDPGLDALRVDTLVAAILRPEAPSAPAQPSADAADQPAADASVVDLVTRPRALPRCSCGGAQTAAVVLDLPTALGLADHPGQIPGHGPVSGPLARQLAAERDWVRWTADPGTGHLLDRAATTYRPSEALKAFVAARDTVCGFPGCTRRAQQCDCDHVVNHGTPGGRTVRINLGPLCRQHHNAKTHGRWRLRYDPATKVKTWTSPLGRTYTKGTDPPLV